MKEATGELNTSLIVFTAVALLAAFFFMVIWPNIKGTLDKSAKCSGAVCYAGYNSDGFAYCYTPTGRTISAGDIYECPYRG